MTWLVEISEAERRLGHMTPANLQAGHTSLYENGCLLLRGTFDLAQIDVLRGEFDRQWGGLDGEAMAARALDPAPNPVLLVGEDRYEILLRMAGAFADIGLLANPAVCRFMGPLFGGLDHMKLSGFTAVVSYPGAKMQHLHRDHALLFPEIDAAGLPPHAINMAVPLVDVDAATGPTAVCLGSHRWPQGRKPQVSELSAMAFQRGDALLIDYRTFHTGLPNTSERARPILYMVYARRWFFDDINHGQRPSLDMPAEVFAALPEGTKPLLERAESQRVRARYLAAKD